MLIKGHDLPEISSTSTYDASSFSVSVVLRVAGVITGLWPSEVVWVLMALLRW